MKVSNVAEIAGVSVRTIRHYHAIGLMPIPPSRGAWRDYSFEDVARLVRIRTLVNAGVPLAEIPQHFRDDPHPVENYGVTSSVYALERAIDGIDEQIFKLQQQRQRLELLKEQATGPKASSLPVVLAETYDGIEKEIRESGDTTALLLFRRERLLIELAAQLGFISEEFSFFVAQADYREIAEFYRKLGDLSGKSLTPERCTELVSEAFAIIESYGEPPVKVQKILRDVSKSRVARLLCLSAAPSAGHRRFIDECFTRFAAYFAPVTNSGSSSSTAL